MHRWQRGLDTHTYKSEHLVAERKVLKKILGPTQQQHGYRRVRTNDKIEEVVAQSRIIGEKRTDFAGSAV